MAMTANAIIFAINSAIRLGRNAQRAYSKSLTSRSIVLPLPNFTGTPNEDTARRFFENKDPQRGGAQYLSRMERLKDIHERYISTSPTVTFPSTAELELYKNYFANLSSLLDKEAEVDFKEGLDDNKINADELVALLSIRQYTDPNAIHTTPLQMVAGTIVEIGIDYFNQIPGALNEKSATGRAMKHFLTAFDDVKFSDNELLKGQSRKMIPQLFIAAAETMSGISNSVSNDPKFQAFIKEAGQGIATDLAKKLATINDSDNQEEAVRWGQLLLRSTVANASEYVFASPQDLFNTNEATTELIKSTSGVLLDAILQDPDKIDIKAGLNAETLDRLLQSSFGILAEHPQLAGGKHKAFQAIVAGVSGALKDFHYRRPDLFPEMVRIVLEQTGRHMQLFWQPLLPDGTPGRPPEGDKGRPHDLLIQALQLILQEISAPVQDNNWRPRLSKSQLLFITEELLSEVVDNPAWVESQVAGKPLLASVVRTTIDSLGQLPKEERLGADVFRWLLEINLRTVAANDLVLTKIKWSNDTEEKAVLQHALSLVFAFVFQKENTTAGDRYELLSEILDYVLEVIVSRHPDSKGLMLVDMILSEETGVGLSGGFDRDWANALMDAALGTLAAHPDLVTKDAALSEIIKGVAGAINASSFQQKSFLQELIRLCLENTALNLGLITNTSSDQPEYLLVGFIKELLFALSTNDSIDGEWQPQLSPSEALTIVDNLINELIQHPEWIIKGPDGQVIFQDVMVSVRSALQNVPPGVSLSSVQIEYLMALALQAAATSNAVLNKIPWGSDSEKRTVLERALGLVTNFVFTETKASGGEQLARFADLVEYVLEVIVSLHPDERGLQLVQLILFSENDIDYSKGFDDELATELMESGLRVLQQRPDLLSGELALQAIVSDLAGSLDANDFRRKGILPELVRLSLEATATNAQLIVKAESGEPQFMMVIALQNMIEQLTSKEADDVWHPQLNGDSMLILAESLLDELVQHPQWIIKGNNTSSLWVEVLDSVMSALRALPVGTRVASDVLEDLITMSLYTAANSPSVMQKIKWADDDQERVILNRAISMLVDYIYPTGSTSSPARLARFLDLLDYILEVVIGRYPDKRSLLILDLLLFESEVDLSTGFNRDTADELVAAALDIMQAHPDLLTKDEIFKKILSDTAGALRASRTNLDHLLPEFIRLILSNASGHLEGLMKISPNSPRILLAVALEQILRVVTQPPSRGRWRPTLTDDQLLMVVETVLERVVARPQWVGNDKLIQLTLEAIYNSLGELRRGEHLPFSTVHLLIEAGLDAVGQRQQLVLEIITADGKESVVLEYALGNLMLKLYDEQGGTAGSWTLTETDTLHNLLSAYLLRMAAGPANQELTDAMLKAISDAIEQINNNLSFAIEDLLMDIEEAGSN
jgi:hypothetical protein